jgi:hypothetical protein
MLGVEGLIDSTKNGIIIVTLQALAPGAHLGRRYSLALRVLEVVVEAIDGAVDVVGEGVAIAHTHTIKFPNKKRSGVGGALGALLGHAVLEEVLGEDGHEFENLRHQIGVGRLDGAVAALVVRHGGREKWFWWWMLVFVVFGVVVLAVVLVEACLCIYSIPRMQMPWGQRPCCVDKTSGRRTKPSSFARLGCRGRAFEMMLTGRHGRFVSASL